LGETEYFVGRSARGDENVDCSDWFQVPATLELSTADGALEVVAHGDFSTREGYRRYLGAVGDLADAVGTLNLHPEPSQQYRAGMSVVLEALNEGKRGSLELFVEVAGCPRERYVNAAAWATRGPLASPRRRPKALPGKNAESRAGPVAFTRAVHECRASLPTASSGRQRHG
jgi:hypothetical protein